MSEVNVFDPEHFLNWFKGAGGWYDESLLGLKPFEGMGYGAVALKEVPDDAPLFHIPDELILSSFTSDLKDKVSPEEWERLDHGWCRLILTMMYETIRGDQNPWSGYLANMPVEFDTPMLWNEDERAELAGTDIQDRIGKDGAEEEYRTYLQPVIEAHTDLFPPSSPHTTISAFHLQGSRILSRSFTVPLSRFQPSSVSSDSDSDDDEDEEQVAVMIPFADMLNAAFERDNAHLYGDEESKTEWKEGFTMKSTKVIAEGEQVYNTYASPPNAELLRKYGHVDVLPLPKEITDLLQDDEVRGWPYGNPADEVLLDGTLVVEAVAAVLGDKATEKWRASVEKRIDWWLEEGQEDMFPLSFSSELDDELVAFIRLLMSDQDWLRAKKKGKMPSTSVDNEVANVVLKAIEKRREGYRCSLEDDLDIVASVQSGHIPRPEGRSVESEADKEVGLRKCYAAVVRIGEKRILNATQRVAEGVLSGKKRKAEGELEK
ncbi:hypothetical protein IAU60_000394 [Kwoniella sp. DSM 27419]